MPSERANVADVKVKESATVKAGNLVKTVGQEPRVTAEEVADKKSKESKGEAVKEVQLQEAHAGAITKCIQGPTSGASIGVNSATQGSK